MEEEYSKQKEQVSVMTEAFKLLEKDFTEQKKQVDELLQQVELIDNNSRKNNIRIKNLKEDIVGQDFERHSTPRNIMMQI